MIAHRSTKVAGYVSNYGNPEYAGNREIRPSHGQPRDLRLPPLHGSTVKRFHGQPFNRTVAHGQPRSHGFTVNRPTVQPYGRPRSATVARPTVQPYGCPRSATVKRFHGQPSNHPYGRPRSATVTQFCGQPSNCTVAFRQKVPGSTAQPFFTFLSFLLCISLSAQLSAILYFPLPFSTCIYISALSTILYMCLQFL